MGGFSFEPQQLLDQILTLLTDPTSNIQAALVLYAFLAILLTIVLIAAILFILASSEEEESGEGAAGAQAAPSHTAAARVRPRVSVVSLAVVAGVLLSAWIVAGWSTGETSTCESCHVRTPHSISVGGNDPHKETACVSCHEPGGIVTRYVSALPSRAMHFVSKLFPVRSSAGYGYTFGSSCERCHRAELRETTTNRATGVRMSHKEPLEAGATCLDCHKPIDGLITASTIGMNPCLRCHGSNIASAECTVCHDKKTAAAARASSTAFAQQQVKEVRCGGCHDQARECDTCHGVRMPHSAAFVHGGHARAGAINYWYNGGQTCSKCHSAVRRPCTKCHGPLLGFGHLAENAESHKTSDGSYCNSCHNRWAPRPTRNFCVDMCHTPEAIAASAQ